MLDADFQDAKPPLVNLHTMADTREAQVTPRKASERRLLREPKWPWSYADSRLGATKTVAKTQNYELLTYTPADTQEAQLTPRTAAERRCLRDPKWPPCYADSLWGAMKELHIRQGDF